MTDATPPPRLPAWMRAGSPVMTYVGVGVGLLGFVLIFVAWGQVAGESQVYRQLPYLVSAGLTGLGLVMVGLTVINVAAKRHDEAERARQMDRLAGIVRELASNRDERETTQ